MTAHPPALDRFYGVIPAGGVGSRLWPLSRASAPKFLHPLSGSGESLLRDTWQRLAPLSGAQRIMVVTGRAHEPAVIEQIPELDARNLVLESSPRDSSAAIGLAAAILRRREPDVIIGSFHADHVVRGVAAFGQAVREAVEVADEGYIVTIGITPSEPSTGFGYIRAVDSIGLPDHGGVLLADSFTEKPDLDTAIRYLHSGDYLWNAGMFVSRADVLVEQLRAAEPGLVEGLEEIAAAWDTEQRDAVVERIWPELTKIAIDYTVAEPAAAQGRLAVVPGRFSWHDVGDFATIAQLGSQGRPGQLVTIGDSESVMGDEATGLVYSATGRVISLIGLTDIVVVDTADALLVTTTANAQRVKQAVEQLKAAGRDDVL
ncbi:mannose-1-phosphate guanylyltransferase [Homoserinibacter sp. YIM 151385]|uniref:mannose-1-phosphate guanylyltransferase n=1 Tax=Homoserinibacter sp. YIM 151385 TaxID=2985506 RepID=UPI0022F0FB83|nr:mannose-1-phosphate guanylyltransferase [Homoserinibacter sp. YIM 151385]WBU36823.1 mannose-1-phosphate guanylyltransferase [Homoserinibacter sp. YIM 151385]